MKEMISRRNACLGHNNLVEHPTWRIALSLTKLNFIAPELFFVIPLLISHPCNSSEGAIESPMQIPSA